MALPRSCVRCPTLIASGSLCVEHQRQENKIRNDDRKIRKEVVAANPHCMCTRDCVWHIGGNVCGSTMNLSADHVVAVARGGTNTGPRQTMCVRCNSSKREGRR